MAYPQQFQYAAPAYPMYGGYYPTGPVPTAVAPDVQRQMATPTAGVAQTAQQTGNGILWVQGEEGAKAYMIAPGASVLLMDSENSSFYIKSSDPSGMPLPLRVFDYVERDARPAAAQGINSQQASPAVDYVTREEFDRLAARIDAVASAATAARNEKPSKKDKEEYNYE